MVSTARGQTNTNKERVELRLLSMVQGGNCLARLNGETVFVPFGIPGEDVVVDIVSRKNGYARGRIVAIANPSQHRVEPPCPLFGQCGGCQLQHVVYAHQVELKQRIVAEQLQRLGGLGDVEVNPTMPSPEQWNYRNHGSFSLKYGVLGFTLPRSHDFLRVDECPLMHPAINEALGKLQGRVKRHVHQISIRHGVNTDQSLVYPSLPVPEDIVQTGQPFYEESLLGRRFRVNAVSFFQVNTPQAEQMVSLVNERVASKRPEVVLDVYCGVGAFGLMLAGQVKRLIGIEDSNPSIRDARYNADGLSNATFIKGAAEDVMPKLQDSVDAVILDPPRAGCRPEVIEAISRLGPKIIAYVSCDPATLARDLRQFYADGYQIEVVQPIDMFPQTHHVETCVILSNK